ncbi:hypothetical protein Btru_006385 [Bulinus truncatus]|nr:hypothetical protein Btru_006385 [Bulinus truncatus]
MSSDSINRGQSVTDTESRSHLEGSSANDDEFSNNNNTSIENSRVQEEDCVEPGSEQRNISSPATASHSLPVMINQNIAMSEDSNVDVESEDQGIPMLKNDGDIKSREMISNEKIDREGNGTMSQAQEVVSMADAHYIEKQVVESFLSASSNDLSHSRSYHERNLGSDNRPTTNGNNNYEKTLSTSSSSVSVSNSMINSKSAKSLDSILLTIASVAAGEGEPPEFLTRHPEKTRDERSPYHPAQHAAHFNKNKKRSEKNMSASARLPVISSLLAPSNSSSHNSLPGIQHIASSGRTSNSPTTVLPSVAHFLGPAKSPPLGYTPHHSSSDMYGTGLSSAGNETHGHHSGQYQLSNSGHSTPNIPTSSKSKNNRKPVTPAGLRLSMAASEELPDPLPLPQYSEKVLRAKQLGTVAFDRPTVLRETVQFFLQYKHYWSSHDYDRISNLVIELFPEFKDNSDTPGVPANKRIRTDLSMYARNFRRREVSQRKKEGSSSLGHLDQKQDPSVSSHSETPNKLYAHSGSPSGPNNNPSDFCNELLTAASIIESQNTSAVAARNCDFASPASQNQHKVKVSDSNVIHKQEVIEEEEGSTGVASNHHHHQQDEQLDDDEDDTPIHFVYDKDSMAAASRDANNAWQMYSDQMAQALAAENSRLEYGLTSDEVSATQSSTDRLSAMAIWRSTALPDPLPTPPYSDSVIRARESGNTMSARPKIIRETTQFFLALKLWWTAPDYERIAELVLQNFPALVSLQAVKKDLGTCARNMRRRLPASKYKPSSSQKVWNNPSAGLEAQSSDSNAQASLAQGTAEYMKALMAAQNMNLSELGMTQRNLGELAMLAGIKQRIEQHPQDVTDLERQYLAQCTSDEQRQALMASGAFGNDTVAMAALSAFYGQLGMDISVGTKRSMSSEYNTSSVHEGTSNLGSGELLEVPNKRQRRISQAEVEKRLREAELSHGISHENKSHALSVGISEKNLVKREPMSPSGDVLKSSNRQQHQNPLNMPVFPSSSVASAHEQAAYWDANMALIGAASMAHSSARQIATQAHSQAEIHHLSGHDHSSNLAASEGPMNLTYHESDKHNSQRPHMTSDSPLHDSLPDTAGLAAQVEITTSSIKSHSPRRRTSSSPRSSQQGDQSNSRDQVRTEVWFPHGAGFKKENQEIVCLPDPLPIPTYSQKIITARDDGLSMRHRSEIIRETARFFLNLKYWWSSADYTRISELVVQQFPDLKDDITADGMTNYRRIQRDLSMCARNLRRSKKPRKMREISDGSNALLDIPETSRPSKKQQNKSSKSSSLFTSSVDKKIKRQSGSSGKLRKVKHEATTSAISEANTSSGLNEDMTAAAALLQQQFMQSSSSSYHPSAHLLPSSHLLPSLQTHPALHEQQMQAQLNSTLLQQQQQQHHHHHHHHQDGHNVVVEESHSAKRLVKEESQESVDQHMSNIKSNAVTPIQRSVTPPSDNQPNLSEVAKQLNKSNHGLSRSIEGPSLTKDEHEKLLQTQVPVSNSMKVYVDPDHGNDLQERFSTLWRKGKFFDASLGVANKKLHVHKLVLLAMSPYLQETFKNADPRSQLEVNLPSDTTYETAKAFLKYIYEGVLEVDTSSVRSLHKIATMLQMTKLAQYCQNFAQQLQEEADQANGAVESEIPKISVNLGELTEIQAQRQRIIEAQALQRLGETSDLHRASSTRYISEDRSQIKSDYLQNSAEQGTSDQSGANSHYIHQDILAQHRALVAASSSIQSTTPSLLLSSSQDVATQQLIQAALARHQVSSPPPTSSASSSMYHQYQQQVVAQADSNSSLLHRLAAPESAVSVSAATSLDPHQQRLALAAYWQAHSTLELMSRNQLTGLTSDPSTLTSASELAAIAATSGSSQDTRHVLPNLGHEVKIKSSGHSRGHHSKEPWNNQSNDSESGHQATMLPETCLPGDMTRSHHGGNSDENT